MHDLRLRRCVERATDGGRLTVALTQLWYLSRTGNSARPAVARRGVPPGLRWLLALPTAAALVACAVVVRVVPAYVPLAAALGVLVAAAVMRHRPARAAVSEVQPSEDTFRRLMTGHWTRTYGGLPERVVDDRPAQGTDGRSTTAHGGSATVSRPRAVVLCTDRAVSVFLRENDISGRFRAVLVHVPERTAYSRYGARPHREVVKEALRGIDGFRAGLPVVVLHDAGVQGALLVPLLRAARPDRVVVDAGLPVAAVRHNRAVRLLNAAPSAGADATATATATAEELRTVAGLSEEDAAWLAEGFWSPLAAVPPRLLESVVVRALEHALTAPDPAATRRSGDARNQGFLTWPGQAPAPGPDTSRTEGTNAA
ncbi:hypothetical protein [Streptomyces lavendulocolor]|uniref:hypothetical protein n=1 Tax=Streptomyces lavendulocolor TaxID=67316 RepID=UPI0031E2120A